MIKPKQRSRLRINFGKAYYILYKWAYWYLSPVKFSREVVKNPMEHLAFSHSSPLFRKLAGITDDLQKNKVQNLSIAIKRMDGLVLKPGETFSYWKQIGATTKLKGYRPGLILHNGKLGVGIGGGLCQLSNLIYWMTLHTPLTVKERWRHSYDVFPDANRTLPFGSGATCAYPYIDLQITNNTKQNFQLKIYLTDQNLVGQWFSDNTLENSYEIYETDHMFKSEAWGGYTRNNVIKRKIIPKNPKLLPTEDVVAKNSAYVMYIPFLNPSQN